MTTTGNIDAHTRLFCVLGRPVSHSKSPLIHNRAFRDAQMNTVYLAFEPKSIGQAVASIRNFGIQGASVTIPFKESVMEHLDHIDDEAREIGAVNTIVNRDNCLTGYNTDSQAAVRPLIPFGIQGKQVLVIGAGGAARAVVYGIRKQGGDIIIANRSREKGEALAREYGARFIPLAALSSLAPDIIINTTSLGMEPDIHVLSCPEDCITPDCVVMDVVYTPLETQLLHVARKMGCRTVDGLSMFVAQGAAQFELWTGIRPDTDTMRQTVLNHMT